MYIYIYIYIYSSPPHTIRLLGGFFEISCSVFYRKSAEPSRVYLTERTVLEVQIPRIVYFYWYTHQSLYSIHRVYAQCIFHDNNLIQYNNACIIIMSGFNVGPEK